MSKANIALAAGAVAVLGGGFFYFRKQSRNPAKKQYYPGAQGLPANPRNGAPQNAGMPTPSNSKGNDAAQIISAAAPIAVSLLPSVLDLFKGQVQDDAEPAAEEPVGSIEGLADSDPFGASIDFQ
jgi:anaerobic selenocysteine-containing dehydrogenase